MFNIKAAAMFSIASLLLTGIAAGSSTAASFTIFNTGVDNAGNALPDLSVDSHYTLVSSPDTSNAPTFVVAAGWPIAPSGPWVANSAFSKWIAEDGSNSANGPVGLYDYRTTFNLTGFDPTTAQITGQWASDNEGPDILINGVSTGNATTNQFFSYTTFAINSGFHSGINTLDFLVFNDGGPEGLRVDAISGTAKSLAAVPEPSQAVVLVLGSLFLCGLSVRSRIARRTS